MKKNGELKGFVLDLRGNPGGLLEQAARVADKFLVSVRSSPRSVTPGSARTATTRSRIRKAPSRTTRLRFW